MINFNFLIPQSYSTIRPTFNLSPSVMGTALQNPFKLTSLTDNITKQSNIDLAKLQVKNTTGNTIAAQSLSALGSLLGSFMQSAFGDEEAGQIAGSLVGSAVGTTFSKMGDNLLKGVSLQEGLAQDVGASVAGAGAGIIGNYIGKGINSLGGNSRLSRGLGATTASGIGSFGGMMASNAIKGQALFNGLSSGSLAGMVGNAVGAGLSAASGPSREYNGRYGKVTKGMDMAYNGLLTAIGFVPGWGQLASSAMALNKGLSNIFGSTDAMTRLDAILGSAFMPAPVKWLNMAGARTTEGFKNQSWLNTEKTNSFMQNAYGNLQDRFDKAREEGGRTYGTFSRKAYKKAQANVNHANNIWDQILALADQNELQNIRSLYMTSINNQRYAQNIQGGFSPLARGKQGMKILNNATNHNMGMRLLSAAALIDNKQMILSAQSGTKMNLPEGFLFDTQMPEVTVYGDVERARRQNNWLKHRGQFPRFYSLGNGSGVKGIKSPTEKGLEIVSPEFYVLAGLRPGGDIIAPVTKNQIKNIANLTKKGLNNLTSHVQGDEAVKMFKEYGGTPIPEGSVNGEQLRKYVAEARERYGLVGNNGITDEEIALALYKHSKELGGNTAAVNALGEPLLLFRGDTLRYTQLKERMSPEEGRKMNGTMDNSLGNLFLGEYPGTYPDIYDKVGVSRYLHGKYLTPQADAWLHRHSATGKSQASEIDGYQMFLNKGYRNRYLGFIKDKSTEEFPNDLNIFIVRTPKVRDATLEIPVLEEETSLPLIYKGSKYRYNSSSKKFEDAITGRLLFPEDLTDKPLSEHFENLLKDALLKNEGLLKSNPNSPIRNEHQKYTYFALPNFNIRNAKHLLPYDLRIPRDWTNPNIYKAVTPYIIGGSTAATLYNTNK